MAENTQEQINAQLKSENENLKKQNEDLAAGLKELSDKFNRFTSAPTAPKEQEKLIIPTETFKVTVGKETFKIKFLIPKFRLSNDLEITALEASTDEKIMQQLIQDASGVIQIISE